ncbi:hypothetical protein RJ639_041034 [Escallonia herrerae]|uniref:Uncharacterized protein n=1 Tax=Escallonia herrerae TaxID=1293975 RepID=A0AA88WD28_9ASTE|nr:hypothetical protein RJ639_041034 [Escallonia herrerae]
MAGALPHLHGRQTFLSFSKSHSSRLSSPASFRPVTVAMGQSQSYWASIDAKIEDHLKKSIPIRPPVEVFEPMQYLSLAPPRTAASALCVAACELVGGYRDDAVAAASAVHLMHAAAFGHEHLPLTDRARPKPAVHHQYNPNIELLTGDGILPFGLELLAKSVDPARDNSDRVLRVIVEITRAVGSQGTVDGQYREFLCTQSDGDELCNAGWVEYACEKKEGGLHACGAILGGGNEEEIERLRKYGLYVGTIQGMLHGVGRNKEGMKEAAEKLRALALKELDIFSSRKTEPIASLVQATLVNA